MIPQVVRKPEMKETETKTDSRPFRKAPIEVLASILKLGTGEIYASALDEANQRVDDHVNEVYRHFRSISALSDIAEVDIVRQALFTMRDDVIEAIGALHTLPVGQQ